jgi:hypothetical protein
MKSAHAAGGLLAVEMFRSGTEPVLAIHGARATADLIAEAPS